MERGGESSESGELGGSGKWREEVSQVSCVSRGEGVFQVNEESVVSQVSWIVQVNGERG